MFTFYQSSMAVNLQNMKTYAFVIHEASRAGTFNIHIICPDCMIPMLPFVDYWTNAGLTQFKHYFGKPDPNKANLLVLKLYKHHVVFSN